MDTGGGLNEGVTAAGGSAWAVGHFHSPGLTSPSQTLLLRWNGTSWARVSLGTSGSFPELHAVAASSATNVWAVGETQGSSGWLVSLVYYWNGSNWRLVPSPGSYYSSNLRFEGVTTSSAANVWTAGYTNTTLTLYGYLAKWNGTVWSAWAT